MFLTKSSRSIMFLNKHYCLWCVAWGLCITVACIGVGCDTGGDVVTPIETETEQVTEVTETEEVTGGGETPVVTPEPEPELKPEPHNYDDPFAGQGLQNPNWRWRNEPDKWDVGITVKNHLYIEAQEDNRNLWASDNTHFLYQETSDDAFDVHTHFLAAWDTDSGVCGLLVKSPADNDWVTLKFWGQGKFSRVQFQRKGRGLGFPDSPWVVDEQRRYFRIRKEGNAYTGFYKNGRDLPWIKIGTAHVALTPPLQVGIYAGNAADKGWLTASYLYFGDPR